MQTNVRTFVDKIGETYNRALMIHDLDETVKQSDINKVIAKSLNSNQIKFHIKWSESTFIHNRKSQCAIVILPHEDYVTEIMKQRPIKFFGREVSVSRQLPMNHYLSHKITCGLKVQLPVDLSSKEYVNSIEAYFRNYGSINYREYSNNTIYFIFDDYDDVDRIIIEKTIHRVKGIEIRVEKLLLPHDRRTIATSDIVEYCIHVTNLPNDVTGEELANIFRVDVANILIRPYNELQNHSPENERKPVEVWISDIGSKEYINKLANEKNESLLRGCRIHCQIIPTPVNHFDLCEYYQRGTCGFSISCQKKHIRCVEPIDCQNTQCWYGHDKQRRVRSERLPRSNEDGYRVRIINFPPNVTRQEIYQRLRLKFHLNQSNITIYNENNPSAPTIVYVTDQTWLGICQRINSCMA